MGLQILRGGLLDSANTSKKEFIKAYATNTRLMGVTAVHAIWYLPDNFNMHFLHQFFYFDAEEFGFDTYKSVLAKSLDDEEASDEILENINKMMGCLGGKEVEITEKELRALSIYYRDFTINIDDKLPDNFDEYSFLFDEKIELSDIELANLYNKICEPIKNDYQVIHYFLMRVAGKDFKVARHISKPGIILNVLKFDEASSLLKNTISLEERTTMTIDNLESYFSTFQTGKKYMTESLIENEGEYFLLVSEIVVENLKVKEFKKINLFKVSSIEADLMSNRSEFIATFETMLPPEILKDFESPLTFTNCMLNEHENGSIFMIFNDTNDHVKERIYRVSNDVKGVYYVSNFGEVIVMSYSKEGLDNMIEDLKASNIYQYLEKTAEYEFEYPILYSFVESNYLDFTEFIEDFID